VSKAVFSRRSFVKSLGLMAGASLVPTTALRAVRFQTPGAQPSISTTPIPRIVVTDFSHRFNPAYLSNGLIGIRPGPNPLAQAPTAVSGFVRSSVPYQMQALSPAPYPLMVNIEINGESLLERPELVKILRQELDMATGELATEMTFTAGGASWALRVLQFASRSIPALLCQEIRITPSATTSASIIAQIGIEGVPGTVYRTRPPQGTAIDLVLGFRSDLSKLGVAVVVQPRAGIERTEQVSQTDGGISRRYDVRGSAGEAYRFQTIAAMVSEFYHPEPELEAIRMANWGAVLGFDSLRRQNRARWSDLWQSRVKVLGDAGSQKVLDASFFYLHSSLNPSDMTGMAPFGLSQTRYYYGHSFWDTETWSLLPVTLASPQTGKALLEFRRRSLPYAKKLAVLYGYRGAQFPWEAAPVGGFGVTPTFAATGWEEQHVTPDVALGFWEYQMAAGDEAFLKQATWPVLKAVAQWIASRGIFTNRGFEIRHIMGPDEGLPNVNNDAYVNLISKMVLEAATRCAAEVGAKPSPIWQQAAERMYVPIDAVKNIVLPCDHPPEGRNYPIDGLDMLTVHDPPISRELMRSTFAYEETLRAERPPSIGFATAAVAATAAWLGHRDRARALFEASWRDDWIEPFGMIKEAPVETYGCFLTTCGSLLQTALLGFTGLRIREKDWRAYPAILPQGWSRIEVDRIWVRGKAKRLIAENGQPARLLGE
jgi:protein-glucosylgalactosylhydroxylysine glucosidase